MKNVAKRDAAMAPVGAVRPKFWNEPEWNLGSPALDELRSDLTIRWDFSIGDSEVFTDPAYDSLRESCKAFLWSLMVDPPRGRRIPAEGTLVSLYSNLRVLVTWMARERIYQFVQLDKRLCTNFHEYIAARQTAGGQRALSKSTIAKYLSIFDLLYQQREKLSDSLRVYPFPGRRVAAVAGYRYSDHGHFPHTPDEVAIPFLMKAMSIVDDVALEIVSAFRDAAESYGKALNKGHSRSWAETIVNRELSKRTLSDSLKVTIAGPLTITGLTEWVGHVVTACFVAVTYLVGVRPREACRLKAGCMSKRRLEDGQWINEMNGMIYKSERNSRSHSWVVPNIVVKAIEVLELLSTEARKHSGEGYVFLTSPYGYRMATQANAHSTRWKLRASQTMSAAMNEFSSWADLPHFKGAPWKFSSYQGRKTFARHVALRDRTHLFALARHYGHVDLAVTDYSYAGNDHDLKLEIDNEVLIQSIGAWESMLAADSLAGSAGAEIVAKRPRFRGATAKADIKQYAELLVSSGLTLGVCSWGYCVYREQLSACHGGAMGPNPREREPSTCAKCKNFAVGEKHIPFWVDQVERNQVLQKSTDASPQAKAVAETRIQEAKRLLKVLRVSKNKGRKKVER